MEIPLASPFSISARVLTRQKTGPPASERVIINTESSSSKEMNK
jgi:hypothetical protein